MPSPTTTSLFTLILATASSANSFVNGFSSPPSSAHVTFHKTAVDDHYDHHRRRHHHHHEPSHYHQSTIISRRTSLEMSFFKDIIGKAFENDVSLDKDRTKGQYDGPYDGKDDDGSVSFFSVARQVNNNPQKAGELTETQRKWRQSQLQGGGGTATTTPEMLLLNSKWKLDFFLTGIPDKDPSNDLFASKVNISSRDRKVGLMIPDEPTVSDIMITLLENGVCQIESDSDFIDQQQASSNKGGGGGGAWKVSDDGSMIRICLDVTGYQRTVKTKGSIEKVFWSKEDEQSIQTSTAYTIPAGPIYGDAMIQSGNRVGILQWSEGILRVEQSSGLLGAGSKMTPCGRFSATRLD